jgi:integrase/recombinase XerD
MEISCGNCSNSFPYSDFETSEPDIIECPGCRVRVRLKATSAVTEYGAELYGQELQILEPAPALIVAAGKQSQYAWEEFFNGNIANSHTRRAYKRAVTQLLDYVASQELSLLDISPAVLREYFDNQLKVSLSSKKQILAGLRHFFDYQVMRHAMLLNPALSIRLERMEYRKGKTRPLAPNEARMAIEALELKSPIDLRDRVILGLLTYTACRIGALTKINLDDFEKDGSKFFINMKEKNGKLQRVPVRLEVREWIEEYLNLTGIEKGALLRAFSGRQFKIQGALSESALHKTVKKRLNAAGLGDKSAHSFRAGAATELLSQGVSQEDVQLLLGHADPRTTQLYDHSKKEISQNIVERI